MTVIDHEERCAMLGVSIEDFFSSERKISDRVAEALSSTGDVDESIFEEYKDFLTEGELIATIRWNNLHKAYPHLFTWDGAVE